MAHELLLACAWKGTVILLGACGMAAMARGTSAAARHVIWASAFLALLLLPLFYLAVPAWRVLPQHEGPRTVTRATIARSNPQPAAPAPKQRDWLALIWLAGTSVVLARFAAGCAR